MPLSTVKPKCSKCEKTESALWKTINDLPVCLECFESPNSNLKLEPEDGLSCKQEDTESNCNDENNKNENDTNGNKLPTRKSTRSTRYKPKTNPVAYTKPLAPKGKGRRIIFKKAPLKAPSSVSTVVTSQSIFFKGSYIQVGDIVSVIDTEGDIYYAQIRGLLTDQYCEKSAVLTWLLPTKASPAPALGFDPATYVIGPEEDIPRKLECMEFIMHAPSEYYKSKSSPYPSIDEDATLENGFIWTTLDPVSKINSES